VILEESGKEKCEKWEWKLEEKKQKAKVQMVELKSILFVVFNHWCSSSTSIFYLQSYFFKNPSFSSLQ